MTSLLRSRELYLLLLFIPAAFCTTRSAVAQRAPVGQPVISRMCLWNAGKAVWRALDLHRDQVRHLNVIRQRYPAVVQGQWVSGSDSADVDLHYAGRLNRIQAASLPAQGMRARASGKNSGNPHEPEVRMERLGLQTELREVLSDAQLRKWEELCK